MKKLISLIMAIVIILSLSSCDDYVSSYSAIGLVRSNTSHGCEASFHSLSGTLVFKISKSHRGEEGDIKYTLDVEVGEVNLYYDCYGVKEKLARATAGEKIEACGGYVEGGHTVYIIIEAEDGSRGRVSVELDHD